MRINNIEVVKGQWWMGYAKLYRVEFVATNEAVMSFRSVDGVTVTNWIESHTSRRLATAADLLAHNIPRTEWGEHVRVEPSPCPWCGGKAGTNYANGYDEFVRCVGNKCAATGPLCSTNADAITAWNVVADAMAKIRTEKESK